MSLEFNHAAEILSRVEQELIYPPQGVPLPWWPKMNESIGGLRMGELTVLCAPTGAGKTQLLANIACQLVEQKVSTFCAPVETGDVDFLIRMLSVFHKKDLNRGEPINPGIVDHVMNSHRKKIESADLYISTYDGKVPIDEMSAMLLFQIQNNGVKIALLDNLNFFLNVTRAADQNLEIDESVRMLGDVAKKNKIHIILVCHPKKTDGGIVSSEFDIKGSSTVVQEAANVLLFNRPKETESTSPLDRVLIFKKMRRRGLVVNQKYGLRFNYGRYEEIEIE